MLKIDAVLLKHFDKLLDEEERAPKWRANLMRNSCRKRLGLFSDMQMLVNVLFNNLTMHLLRCIDHLDGESWYPHEALVPHPELVELSFW